nr:hypothetical protein [Aeromicrobium sp.]
MEESSFEIDSTQLAEASMLFPAHRLAPVTAHPASDVSYLATGPEFGRQAWDEAGHL